MANVTVGLEAVGVAYDDSSRDIYVTNGRSNSTSIISGTSVVATVPLGRSPWGVTYDSRNRDVYVANPFYSGSSVTVINGSTIVATIPIQSPLGLAFDAHNGYVYAGRAGSVSVINGTTVIANITTGIGVDTVGYGVAYDNSNGYIYVTDYGSDTVNVISGTTVIANVTVGTNPFGVGYDASNGYMYVANQGSGMVAPTNGTVSVINGTTVIATVPVGIGPWGVAYAGSNGYVYVANSGASSLSVINGTAVIDTIPVAEGPSGIAYDTANRYIYVASSIVRGNSPSVVNVISTTTDYALSNNGPVNITSGGVGNVTITTTLTSSAPRRVELSCSGLSTGITCQTFNANPVMPTTPGSQSVLTISVASSVSAGLYSFQVTCSPLGMTTTPTRVSVVVTARNSILGLDPTTFYTALGITVAALAGVLVVAYRVARQRRATSANSAPLKARL